LQLIEEQIAGHRTFDTREQLLEDAKGRRGDAGGHAGVHALGEHAHPQSADQVAAQRSGAPDLAVIAALGIETHDQRGLAERRTEGLQMCRQIVAAALLAGFDEHHAARQGYPLLLEHGNRRERAEHRVTVIGGAAAVESAVADDRLPGSKSRQPAGEFRLLVEMPVEQHAAGQLAGHVDEQQRRTPRQAPHLDTRAGQCLPAAPLGHQCDRCLHVTVTLPLRIEHRRLVRNAHIGDQALDDRLVPGPADRGLQPLKIHADYPLFRNT